MVQVGAETELLSADDAALAPAGVVHSIRNPGPHRLVVMAVLAPPPRRVQTAGTISRLRFSEIRGNLRNDLENRRTNRGASIEE
jgi:hypothetical protein